MVPEESKDVAAKGHPGEVAEKGTKTGYTSGLRHVTTETTQEGTGQGVSGNLGMWVTQA